MIEPTFLVAYSFCEGLARVGGYGDEPYGFIDKTGNYVIDPVFVGGGGNFSDGRALMMDYHSNRFGFIDTAGNIVIEPTFEDAGFFSEGIAPVKEGEKWGYIDTAGKWAIEPMFNCASIFSEGLADVNLELNNGMVLINRQGVEVLEIDYIRTGFSEGLAWVQKDGKLVCINNLGETQIEYEQNNEPKQVSQFSEGLAAIEFQ